MRASVVVETHPEVGEHMLADLAFDDADGRILTTKRALQMLFLGPFADADETKYMITSSIRRHLPNIALVAQRALQLAVFRRRLRGGIHYRLRRGGGVWRRNSFFCPSRRGGSYRPSGGGGSDEGKNRFFFVMTALAHEWREFVRSVPNSLSTPLLELDGYVFDGAQSFLKSDAAVVQQKLDDVLQPPLAAECTARLVLAVRHPMFDGVLWEDAARFAVNTNDPYICLLLLQLTKASNQMRAYARIVQLYVDYGEDTPAYESLILANIDEAAQQDAQDPRL